MVVIVKKFIASPIFPANLEEDVMDRLERSELVAAYNRWTDADQARNVVMYVEGEVKKLLLVHTNPDYWKDLPIRPRNSSRIRNPCCLGGLLNPRGNNEASYNNIQANVRSFPGKKRKTDNGLLNICQRKQPWAKQRSHTHQ